MVEDQSIFSSKVIISLILTTFSLYCVLIFLGENIDFLPLLGLTGLTVYSVQSLAKTDTLGNGTKFQS